MVSLLFAILNALWSGARHTWTFIKARALVLWAFATVVLPKIFKVWRGFRLLRIATVGGVFYMLYRVIHDTISALVIVVDLSTGIGSLMSDLGWASWLIWDGPLQMAYLWDQLLACVSFKISLNVVALAYTKIRWFMGPLFTGGIGPRS